MNFCVSCAFRCGFHKSATTHDLFVVDKDVFIPKRSPSQNEFNSHHWTTYRKKHHNVWTQYIHYYVGRGKDLGGIRPIAVTVVHKNARSVYDHANMVGGFKPVMDCLKVCGWFKDDTTKYVVDWYDQTFVGEFFKEEGTQLTIYKQIVSLGSVKCSLCKNSAVLECDVSILGGSHELST